MSKRKLIPTVQDVETLLRAEEQGVLEETKEAIVSNGGILLDVHKDVLIAIWLHRKNTLERIRRLKAEAGVQKTHPAQAAFSLGRGAALLLSVDDFSFATQPRLDTFLAASAIARSAEARDKSTEQNTVGSKSIKMSAEAARAIRREVSAVLPSPKLGQAQGKSFYLRLYEICIKMGTQIS